MKRIYIHIYIRKRIDTTQQEITYRLKHFHDIRIIKNRQIVCASCGNQLKVEAGHVFSHPLLELLQCETCQRHFKHIDKACDENICYICGHHKKLYVCSDKKCLSTFCKNCIKRNTPLVLLDAEHENWKCFICKSRPLWDLRGVCAAVMDTLPKRCNRSNVFKTEKRCLPSQKEKIEKTRKVQRSLRALCDDDEDSVSEPRPSFSARFAKSIREANNRQCRRLQTLEVTIVDSDMTSESEVDLRRKVKRERKPISSSRDSSSSSQGSVSKSIVSKKEVSKRNRDSSNSDLSLVTVSDEITKTQPTKKSHNESTKRQKRKIHVSDASDSENDKGNPTNKVSRTSKNLSKHKQLDKKKSATLRNRAAKNKDKKYHDSTSESEDEDEDEDEIEDIDIKNTKRSREKHSASRTTSHSEGNEMQKYEKRENSERQPLREDDSDSSSKEFQKEKLLRTKYSLRKLKDLVRDYTKLVTADSPSSEKITNRKDHCKDNSNLTFDDVKKILKECKSVCSSFQKYIEFVEKLYEKENEDKLVILSARKVDKYTTALSEKRKDLMSICESWSKRPPGLRNAPKKVYKKVSHDERSSDESDTPIKCKTQKNESHNSKNQQDDIEVSECDSEEIFSANESRSPQKMRTTHKTDPPKIDSSGTDNDEYMDAQEALNKSKDSTKSTENLRDALVASPVLGTSEQKKANTEGSSKQLDNRKESNDADNKAQTKNRNNDLEINQAKSASSSDHENEIDVDSPSLKKTTKKTTLQNNNNARANLAADKDMINESIDDLFDSSFDGNVQDMDTQKTDAETNNDKAEHVPKTKSANNLNACETLSKDEANYAAADADNDEIPSVERETTSPERNEKEVDSASRNDLEKVESAASKKSHNVDNNNSERVNEAAEKADSDDAESLEIAEALAKQALLQSDSENITNDSLPDTSLTKPSENAVADETKEHRTEDIDSDVSTLVLSPVKNKEVAKDTDAKAETNPKNKSNDKLSEAEKTKNLSDEDRKAEETAKKALLAGSTSDDSTSSPSRELEENAAEKRKSKKSNLDTVASANIKAKKALLASSNSDTSFSEASVSETAVLKTGKKNSKRKREIESDAKSALHAAKKKKLYLHKNIHYMNDEKLRMICEVRVKRLPKKILKRYSHALQKSKRYLEHKALKSLVNLDTIEKRYKNTKKDSDTSTDDDNDASSKISRRSNKGKGKQATKETEESLMDHLKKVENEDPLSIQAIYSSDESADRIAKVDTAIVSNEDLLLEANKAAKQNLLNSTDSDAEKAMVSDNDSTSHDDKNKKTENKKKKSQPEQKKDERKSDESKKEKNEKSSWRRNKILTLKLSDTDSDAEKEKWKKKQERLEKEEKNNDSDEEKKSKLRQKKKKGGRRIIYSDSDIKITDCDSDSSSDSSFKVSDLKKNSSDSVISLESADKKKQKEKLKRRRKRRDSKSSDTDSSFEEKRPKPKRKRIKKMASDSDSSDVIETSQGTPNKSGRKNIRKVLKDKQVAEDTKQAAKEEEERLKRIAERQALYNEMYEMRLAGEEKIDKLVLDFDTTTKEELVSVHEGLVKRLKPHQAQGIKFMWDACYESLERIKTTSGSGCIIAHCMGLGKTLQVIALTHTLLTHEMTDTKTVLIVCPLSTVLNWVQEYKTWLANMDDDVDVYELTKFKKNFERKCQLQVWQRTGGVLIIGYEMFRNLTGPNKNIRKGMKETILECLIDPGPDLIVCDEGHLLKNEDTALSKCIRMVKTLRRIVLTGTPLQNNLIEYHCMVQFVKPNLLGTKKEFLNRFVNPITNGQFDDSTEYDVKLMKKRAHVLHKMLEGSVQRFDYSVLTPFLPPKQEYVIFVRLTETQIKMYQYYLANLARRHHGMGGSLFADFQALQRIWTHPIVLRLNAEKIEKANEKKGLSTDSEGSLKDFINDDSTDADTSSSDSSNDSDVQTIDDTNVPRRKTRNNPGVDEPEPEPPAKEAEVEWWSQFVQPEHFEDMKVSAKLLLLFGILKESEQIGDKVLVFSQSLYSLTLIEAFLRKIDDETQSDKCLETLDNHTGSWCLGLDYFRLDGQTSADNRSMWCKLFNKPSNIRARLFLISTRAGGLGINLTAANRVIIFDASWNPSHDVQSIFRIYRFGQKKPCYVYRFLAAGTMEEKIYNRQVTKLSLSCRVVDEQQIERHYSNHNLNELYTFEPYDTEKPTLNLPKDRLLAEIFLKHKDIVENYHEHDSLLENKAEEELDEEERKQAWLEYEEEKKGKPMIMAYQNNIYQQQYNMMINAEQIGLLGPNFSLQRGYEDLQQIIQKDFPNATPEQQKMMVNRTLADMYNYWEQQAVLQPVRNTVPLPTYQLTFPGPQATTSNNAHQLTQLLKGQTVNYGNVKQSAQSGMNLLQNQLTYRNVPANNARNADNEIVEMAPSTSNTGALNAQMAQVVQPAATNKNQEE
ncbi:transcriptional regulator ATRX-like isoform X2 [Odontomachus brunneus]|uniref:transcriptional regulator ATRX-like isoform X2 n=1 Tax=Odontomachus brunneus TaxID=486640 RepID=UPI0013F1F4EB|nr:transcriptional regulator ATRX-like isoform X2 [Odontomachus brunneus]